MAFFHTSMLEQVTDNLDICPVYYVCLECLSQSRRRFGSLPADPTLDVVSPHQRARWQISRALASFSSDIIRVSIVAIEPSVNMNIAVANNRHAATGRAEYARLKPKLALLLSTPPCSCRRLSVNLVVLFLGVSGAMCPSCLSISSCSLPCRYSPSFSLFLSSCLAIGCSAPPIGLK